MAGGAALSGRVESAAGIVRMRQYSRDRDAASSENLQLAM
jgi:hypothetical protein